MTNKTKKMKKLLYTLLIGLVIVSCQKEEYGGDYAPAALSTDIEASANFLSAKATLESLMGVATPIKGIKASTARDSGNSLQIATWDVTGNTTYIDGTYAHVISEEHTACYNSYNATTVKYDWDTSDDTLTIFIGDNETEFTIQGDLATTYDTSFTNSLYFLARVALQANGAYAVDGSQPEQITAPN